MAEPPLPRSPLEQFLHYLEFEKGFAANTILSYRRELKKFFAFLQEKHLQHLNADSISSATRAKKAGRSLPRRT
jgi:site-specific recombinase XerD